ncbi:hypothetical protein [Flagellimonas algicola]|uniref:Uncharacterized protein n=1 Tax=Flagellimonas algicola TaxID=2583815 RepID=A0ABY2WKG1_9FLAO|nr:hypothetical protein [Allomuricauda algicola]TMU55140.1 hypothetical protein FGG15_13230 [Allomuricauda algicola]
MKPSKIEIVKFLAVMIIFLIGMVIMLIHQVQNTWIWIGYISAWWWVEVKVAKNFHVKLWVWVLILALILTIDVLVILFFVQ